MCGITAFVGNSDATKKVVEGLKKLEYRGYDSWGIGILTDENTDVKVVHKLGKIGSVETDDVVNLTKNNSTVALGHTRWATHGGITELNCHPHMDCAQKIIVVHNGVIENYQELGKDLLEKDHRFISQTDTEIIPHLIEELMTKKGVSFSKAVIEVAKNIKGRSSFVAVDVKNKEMIGARMGSPLILGIVQGATNEFFLGSDVSAFSDYTNKVIYIDNEEIATLKFGNGSEEPTLRFFSIKSGKEISKKVVEIDWKNYTAEKLGYDHFLIKEIMDQRQTVARAAEQDETKILLIAKDIKNASEVFFIGCGTSGKVCKAAEYLFAKIAKKHVTAVVASEFEKCSNYLTNKALVIAISQSGETADVLEAIELAKSKGVKVISILNTFGSTIMRLSDDSLMINAGSERAVASTKATTSQISVVTLLAYATAGKLHEGKQIMMDASSTINNMITPVYETHIKKLATEILESKGIPKGIFIIGKGINYCMAEEAAIKIQETCFISAQGFASGELKHGPLALIENGSVCLALISNDENKDATLSNATEVKARGGYIVGISPEHNDVFDYWIKVPDVVEVSAIINIIPIQLLSYYLAVMLGNNPDYPRNLAKSVTVK